jgi:hypothetical protein
MRPRFSLRSFFAFATLVALICAWCVLPSMAARQFVRALADGDYLSADQMFLSADSRCLEQWDDKHWSFRATGRLAPLTIGQLVCGRRLVRINVNYFALDQTVNRDGLLAVTSCGAKAPEVGPERYGSIIIDSTRNGSPRFTR